jgi:hypothetical protein
MLVEEAFEVIESININFEAVKKTISNTKGFELKNVLIDLATKVEQDLHKLNMEVSKFSETVDNSFLSKHEVSSYPIEDLDLTKVSNQLHNLEVSFGALHDTYLNFPDVHQEGFNLIQLVNKEIIRLIHAFSNVGEKSFGYSNIQRKIIAESMNIIGKELNNQLIDHKKASEKLFKSFEINDIEITAEHEFKELYVKVDNIKEIYDKTLNGLQEKHNQMDEMLGQSANRVMAQDFDLSAVAEKTAANRLRGGSLACMAIIVGIVCYSFYDSTHSGFDWESSIFRTVLVFILSIPAAYLSRESAKHREQQYNYHHTALDLKAITPYIASLPEADQNRIKISIAERIFASRQTNVAQQESFPLNTQDLMMELIKKVNISNKQPEQSKPKDQH